MGQLKTKGSREPAQETSRKSKQQTKGRDVTSVLDIVSEAEKNKICRCQNPKTKELTKYDKRNMCIYMWYNRIQSKHWIKPVYFDHWFH